LTFGINQNTSSQYAVRVWQPLLVNFQRILGGRREITIARYSQGSGALSNSSSFSRASPVRVEGNGNARVLAIRTISMIMNFISVT